MNELKRERHTLEEAGSKLIQEAVRAGADSAEVCGTFGQSSRISLEKQDFHLASTDEGYQLGIRVLKGQQQGFAACNSLEPKDLKEVATRSVEIATLSPPNPHYSIMPAPHSEKDPGISLWDASLTGLSLKSQKEWAQHLAKEFLKDPRIRLNEGSVSVSNSLFLVANSRGTHQLSAETACVWTVMGMAVEGDNITSFDYFSSLSRSARGLADKIIKTTGQFRDRLIKNLRVGQAEPYKGLVVFSPRAVLDVLLESISYQLNGRVLVEGSGKWNIGDIGKSVFNSQITLTDHPWLADRMGCSLFDREGTPTKPLTMIDSGKIAHFLFDNYSAKALNQTSSGHAMGSASTIPSVGTHCQILSGGTTPLAELIKNVSAKQTSFLVINRYSGQTDPITGDFSGVAKGSEWWANGEFQYCLKETLVSGNVYDCLGPALYGMSAETQVVDSSEESPTVVCDGISVTA